MLDGKMSEESDKRSDTTTYQSPAKSDTSCPTVTETEITSETSESGGGSGMASNSSNSVRLSPDECSIKISQKR